MMHRKQGRLNPGYLRHSQTVRRSLQDFEDMSKYEVYTIKGAVAVLLTYP